MNKLNILLLLFLSVFLVASVSAAVALPNVTSCNASISEDTQASCIIDSLNLTVFSSNNISCTLVSIDPTSYTLSYIGSANYTGVASCLVNSTDNLDSNSSLLSITINPVNDAPNIISYNSTSSAVSAIPGVALPFVVNATDIDSAVTINWYIGGAYVSFGSGFNFTKPMGIYTLMANASDGSLSSSVLWTVNVGSTSQYTCSQLGLFSPSGDKLCPGDIFTSSDTTKCCSAPYIPTFSDASGCAIANKSVQISFIEPKSSDLFELGEQINGEYRITNTYSEDQNFDVTAYLYDLTTDTYEASRSDDLSLKTGQTSTITLALKIPEDLDLTDEFVIMVKVEDELCNMNYTSLSLRRPKHIVKITNFFLPDEAYCGEMVNAEINVENSGSSDEILYLNLNNKNLSLDKSTENFNLEKYSGSNKVQKTLSFRVPDNVVNGTYPIRLSLYYSDSNRMEFMSKNLDVTGCRTPSYSTSSSVNNAQNQSEGSNVQISSDAGRIMILAAISLVLIIAILSVLYRVKTIKSRETEEVLNKPVRKTRIKLER